MVSMKKALLTALAASFFCSLPAMAKINCYEDKDINALMYSADRKITYFDHYATLDLVKTICQDNSEKYRVIVRLVGLDYEKKFLENKADLLIDETSYSLKKIEFHNPYGVKPISNEVSAEFDIPVEVAAKLADFTKVLAVTIYPQYEKPRSFTFGKEEDAEIRMISKLGRKEFTAVQNGVLKPIGSEE